MAERHEHLDGLRGLAAAVVMLGHGLIAFDFALYTGDPAASHGAWDIWLSGAPFQVPMMANLSVCLFFAMSGFVLMAAFEASALGAVALLIKRYLRLALPIMAVCLISVALLGLGGTSNQAVAALTRSTWLGAQFHQSASLGAALHEGATALWLNAGAALSYDSSLWTMPIEFAGSLMILAASAVGKAVIADRPARNRFYVALGVVALLVFARSYLGLFAAGALLRQLIPHGWRALERAPFLAWALVAVGLLLGTVPGSLAPWAIFGLLPVVGDAPAWVPWQSGPFFWHVLGAVLMLVGILSSPRIKRWLSTPVPRFLGAISFPLYLIHIPLLMTLGCDLFLASRSWGWPAPLGVAASLLAFFGASIASAAILAWTVERFALSTSARIARRIDRVIAPAAVAVRMAMAWR